MKLSSFLLGLAVGVLATAFYVSPPKRHLRPQSIRGRRSPEPMARPATVIEQQIVVDHIIPNFKEDVRAIVDDVNAVRTSLKDICAENKVMREMLFNV